MNKIILMGNLVKAPELVYRGQGQDRLAVCNFTLAINRTRSKEKKVDFINCTCFRAAAENLSKYMEKGGRVLVEGELNLNKWEKEGVTQYSYNVACSSVTFLNNPKPKEAEPQYANVIEDHTDINDIF